ncbi:MAG TPA: RNA methyltransferase [Anaerolineaceae bacterium]|mgnify:CR=1 FL=1|nr:RNA methyltransferase [Anaerolineaceae bacterium]HPN49963.1 RNA methyltransferase [Anaerolineaceae bacterium]
MISSTHNPRIQEVRELLAHARQRRESGLFILEGVRLVEEAWQAGWKPLRIFFSNTLSPRGQKLRDEISAAGIETLETTPGVMHSLSDTDSPQGILAVMPLVHPALPADLNFVVIADTIRDPGNLGTLLRTAAAAGCQAVLLSPGCVDAFSPKVLRSGMGAHFYIPVQTLDWPEIQTLLKERLQPLQVFLADSSGGLSCWQADLKKPSAILIGSEAEGASPPAQALADSLIHIPMPGRSESLNAAMAGAILIFEAVRQRTL